VVYKVSGSARSASVVYSDSGGANDVHASIPYQITVRLPSGAFFSVAADGSGGTTTGCEVLIDGKTVVNNIAANGPASSECHGTVP